MDGRLIATGDLCQRFAPQATFMNNAELAARSSPVISGYAAALWTAPVMVRTQQVVMTRDAVYPIRKDVHRAWLFLTPPEPPFLAVCSDSMRQHLIWRTPVQWSTCAFTVRVGNRLHRIRPQYLHDMLARFNTWGERYITTLDRDLSKLWHGQLHADAPAEARSALMRLTTGELWALATLAKRNTPVPEQPEPITLT